MPGSISTDRTRDMSLLRIGRVSIGQAMPHSKRTLETQNHRILSTIAAVTHAHVVEFDVIRFVGILALNDHHPLASGLCMSGTVPVVTSIALCGKQAKRSRLKRIVSLLPRLLLLLQLLQVLLPVLFQPLHEHVHILSRDADRRRGCKVRMRVVFAVAPVV